MIIIVVVVVIIIVVVVVIITMAMVAMAALGKPVLIFLAIYRDTNKTTIKMKGCT